VTLALLILAWVALLLGWVLLLMLGLPLAAIACFAAAIGLNLGVDRSLRD
jgi:hypothetical protein